jgi:hypothetical protein
VLAAALALLVFDTVDRRLGWPGDHGVVGYDDNDGGLLRAGLDDLRRTARRTREAQNPGWTISGEDYYAARGLSGWRLFFGSTLALTWLTGFQVARLRLRTWPSALLVLGVSILVFAWLVVRAIASLE